MPAQFFRLDLSTTQPQEVVSKGAVVLSLLVTEGTPGVRYFLRMGSNGDWIGPWTLNGTRTRTFDFGDGLPMSDRNERVFVRAENPVAGAFMIVCPTFNGEGGAS